MDHLPSNNFPRDQPNQPIYFRSMHLEMFNSIYNQYIQKGKFLFTFISYYFSRSTIKRNMNIFRIRNAKNRHENICMYVCMYMHAHAHIYKQREKKRKNTERERERITVLSGMELDRRPSPSAIFFLFFLACVLIFNSLHRDRQRERESLGVFW